MGDTLVSKKTILADWDTVEEELGVCTNYLLEVIKEYFYEIDGELFIKRSRQGSSKKIDDPAGSLYGNGYKYVPILNKRFLEHRLLFLLYNGYLVKEIDHIDRNPLNNRRENLRPTSRSLNVKNRGLQSNNTSGAKGVTWHKNRQSWLVRIKINGKEKFVGWFKDFEEAVEERNAAIKRTYPAGYGD